MPSPVWAETLTNMVSPPHSSGMTSCLPRSLRTRSGSASGLSILLTATTIATLGGAGVLDRLDRLRHDAVVGSDHQHDDVGDVGAAGAHRGERGVARRVDERDQALRRLDLVGADVLGDAAGLARGDLGAADVVEQRGLAVVDVAHDGHDRRPRQRLDLARLRLDLVLELVFLEAHGRVAELLDDQLRGVLVDGLVDGGHHAHLHHGLDDFVGLDRHAVGELADRDRLGQLHFALDRRRGLGELAAARIDADRAPGAGSGSRICFFLKRALASGADVQFLATVLGGAALALVDRLRRAGGLGAAGAAAGPAPPHGARPRSRSRSACSRCRTRPGAALRRRHAPRLVVDAGGAPRPRAARARGAPRRAARSRDAPPRSAGPPRPGARGRPLPGAAAALPRAPCG